MEPSATVTDGRIPPTIAHVPVGGGSATRQARVLAAAAAIAAAAVTVLVSALPFVEFAYNSPEAHVAIETTAALIPLFAAYLVWSRYRRHCLASDLALLAALGVLAITNGLFSAVPAIADAAPGKFGTWTPVGGRMLGAVALVAAAFVPARRVRAPRRAALKVAAACTLALAALAALVVVLADDLPMAIAPTLSPEGPDRPRVVGEAALLAWLAGLTALYGVAAVGFVQRGRRERDELMTWFGVGCVFAAFAYLNYFLFPSLYSDWVYTGDILRLCFHLALLFGAAREVAGYQQGVAEAAVLDERRRMARDLHDGLAQELAFIGSQSKRLAAKSDDGSTFEQLASAADRALDESRDVISALTRPLNAPLGDALEQAAEAATHRFGARLETDLASEVHVSDETTQELCRIVREATTNACRHGGARTVRLTLAEASGLRIEVDDDGSGFDPAKRTSGGFGLTSMKERAQRIGGQLTVRSRPGEGTQVEVLLK